MSTLRVLMVQAPLAWENPAANRDAFTQRLAEAPAADLVVLPEMFSTGFSMASARLAEPLGGPTVAWLQDQARRLDAVVCGSVITSDAGQHYNRFYWVAPDGKTGYYDKRHLFRMSTENDHYSPGQDRVTFTVGAWRVLPQVCYDLRFPVFSRNRGDYDLGLYVANWPAARAHHWRSLLMARAIENQACVIGVNRIGEDGNDVTYSGDSLAVTGDGQVLADAGNRDTDQLVTLDLAALHAYRERFPAWRDADEFTLGGA